MSLRTLRIGAFTMLMLTIMIIMVIGLFYSSYFEQIVYLIKNHIWPTLLAVATFLGLVVGGVVTKPPKTFNLFMSNIYLQLAVLVVFISSASLLFYIITTERMGMLHVMLKSGNQTQLKAHLIDGTDSVKKEIFIPQTLFLKGGTYGVKLIADEYKTFEQEVNVTPGGADTVYITDEVQQPFITFTLKPSDPDQINVKVQFTHISTNNEENTKVVLVPETVVRMEKGAYKIKLADEFSLPWDTVIVVTALSKQEYQIKVKTKRKSGRIVVKTDPSGAKLTINGHSSGITPLDTATMPFGNYTIVIRKGGFNTIRKDIVISDTEPNQILEEQLVRMYWVKIVCQNPNIEFTINGKSYTGSKEKLFIPGGQYTIPSKAPGITKKNTEVDVNSDGQIIYISI